MVPHEREECEWAVVGCSYQCGAHLPRRLMDEHEHDMCPQQPMDIKLERIEKQHEREMVEQKNKIAALETKICEQEVTIRKMKVCTCSGVPYTVNLNWHAAYCKCHLALTCTCRNDIIFVDYIE